MTQLFQMARLPRVTFVTEDGEEALDLSRCGGAIQAIADRVAAAFGPGAPVGLVFRSGPMLVLAWLGVVHAGRVPCVLQYPTEKLSRIYWRDSIRHTMEVCGIRGLIHGPDLAGASLEQLGIDLVLDGLPEPVAVRGDFPASGSILQLSSGTTGFKKGVTFAFQDLDLHMEAYNQALGLGPDDCVVSWLPLYHDMGFVACFLLPLGLGVPIVMMDPITWTRHPALLFDAVAQHRGTVCFMPNFAFEVMAKQAGGRQLPSMRRWISCSEPVYLETFERFRAATGADPATLFACYAMAENVFAVTQSRGLETVAWEGRTWVSCGRPIPGTELKVRDGEILVRSPHSLHAYAGGEDVRDPEGFYATGDLGLLVDGALVVTGRKRDLVNQAGRKFMLNDLDLCMAGVFPDSAGRIASLARFDPALGTERVLFLVEMERFWTWVMTAELHRAIGEATGLEAFECRAVPPAFITKTSSGKINRAKTLEDWTQVERTEASRRWEGSAGDRLREDLASFTGSLPLNAPMNEFMDSLGLVMVRMICEDHGIPFDPGATLASLQEAPRPAAAREPGQVFSIVALVDGLKLAYQDRWKLVDQPFLDALSAVTGCPVLFEHIVVPPLPIVFSDLVFHDYFLPRTQDPGYSAFADCMGKIRRASMLLVDDEDNFRLPLLCTYPMLDHRFIHHELEDFLGHRYTRYTLKHHLLPRKVVAGAEITPRRVLQALDDLRSYLGVPVMTLAFHAEYHDYTAGWDYREYRSFESDQDYMEDPIDLEEVRAAILAYVEKNLPACRLTSGEGPSAFISRDPPHFCSFLVNPKAVEWVVNRFDSFCIMGLPSSVPILGKALTLMGKRFFYSTGHDPGRDDFDCILMTGTSGFPATTKPLLDLVHAEDRPGRPRNLPYAVAHDCPFFMFGTPEQLKRLKPQYDDWLPLGNFFFNGGLRDYPPECFLPDEQD